MSRREEFAVAVVGSANVDLVVEAESLPSPGDTILGRGVSRHAGGKGLNQALAAAPHGPSYFVGAIGSDADSSLLLTCLQRAGVSFRGVIDPDTSGFAVVVVSDTGENQIVVIPGANAALRARDVLRELKRIRPRVIALQLEIPLEVVEAVIAWARKMDIRVVLNASPLSDETDGRAFRELLQFADPVIVNASEARALSHDSQQHGARELARTLSLTARSAIVTDGARGAYVARAGAEVHHVPAAAERVVDTTGAGDTFAGTVAAKLALGYPLLDAACAAGVAAGQLVSLSRADR